LKEAKKELKHAINLPIILPSNLEKEELALLLSKELDFPMNSI
jgi:hypothetical protein